jgi:hypothetical protein
MPEERDALLKNVEQLVQTLDPRPQAALRKILVPEFRVLAVRNYLRADKAKLDRKWAWSEDEIKQFLKSEDRKHIEEAIRDVVREFEALSGDPDVTLKKGDEKRLIRPLDTQIDYWNGNITVRYLGSQLIEKLLAQYSQWSADVTLFKRLLMGTGPNRQVKLERMRIAGAGKKGADLRIPPSPTHATPGLSDHGRSNAFDFVVVSKMKGEVIAGTASRTAGEKWDKPGWTKKLKQAVVNAGDRFEGPLGAPGGGLYEPWHYVFKQ